MLTKMSVFCLLFIVLQDVESGLVQQCLVDNRGAKVEFQGSDLWGLGVIWVLDLQWASIILKFRGTS